MDNITFLAETKKMFLSQVQSDCFGFWEIIKVVREDSGAFAEDDVRQMSLEIASYLLQHGILAGSSPYRSGEFEPWSNQTLEHASQRINALWPAYGRGPDIADDPWFGLKRTE